MSVVDWGKSEDNTYMARRNIPLIVSRESLAQMISQAQAAGDTDKVHRIVGRALVQLFRRQTDSEQRRNDTENLNTVGFSSSDGKNGCITAKTFLKHGRLTDRQLDEWLAPNWRGTGFPKICKYHRQLNEIAIQLREQGKVLDGQA